MKWTKTIVSRLCAQTECQARTLAQTRFGDTPIKVYGPFKENGKQTYHVWCDIENERIVFAGCVWQELDKKYNTKKTKDWFIETPYYRPKKGERSYKDY